MAKKTNLKDDLSSTVKRTKNDERFINVDAETLNPNKKDINSNELEIILYNDMPNCSDVLVKLVNYCECNDVSYAYIDHTKDKFDYDDFYDPNTKRKIGEIGDYKKSHIHFVLFSPFISFSFRKVANVFNVPFNLINKVKNLDSALLYLTHICHPNKAQYDVLDVVSNCKDYVIYLYENCSSKSIIDTVLMYLSKCGDRHNVTVTEISMFLKKSNFRDFDIKQFGNLIRDFVKEHNDNFTIANNLDKYVIDRKNNIDDLFSSKASVDADKYKFDLIGGKESA